MTTFLIFVAAQTTAGFLLPFLRRQFGARFLPMAHPVLAVFWLPVSFLFAILITVAPRLLVPKATPWLLLPIPALHGPIEHLTMLDALTFGAISRDPFPFTRAGTAESYFTPLFFCSVLFPFLVFWSAYFVVWFRRGLEARRSLTRFPNRHSYDSGQSILEGYLPRLSTETIQRRIEPLTLIGSGYAAAILFPAFGTFLVYAGIAHFFEQRRVWRDIRRQLIEQRDALLGAQGMADAAADELLRQHFQPSQVWPGEPGTAPSVQGAIESLGPDLRKLLGPDERN